MEKDFFKTILTTDFGIEILIPNENDRQTVHQIIYEELVQGKIKTTSKEKYQIMLQSKMEQKE